MITWEELKMQDCVQAINDYAQDALEWLSTYGADYNISDEVEEEIRFRLEHIRALAQTLEVSNARRMGSRY